MSTAMLPNGYELCPRCDRGYPKGRRHSCLASLGLAEEKKLSFGLNPEYKDAEPNGVQISIRPVAHVKHKDKVSQKKLNKTEQRWYDDHRLNGPAYIAIPQCLFLPLEGGGVYRPDFLCMNKSDSGLVVVEVKGGFRGPGWEQGYERFKRAATQYKGWFTFQLWTWKNKAWTCEEY